MRQSMPYDANRSSGPSDMHGSHLLIIGNRDDAPGLGGSADAELPSHGSVLSVRRPRHHIIIEYVKPRNTWVSGASRIGPSELHSCIVPQVRPYVRDSCSGHFYIADHRSRAVPVFGRGRRDFQETD